MNKNIGWISKWLFILALAGTVVGSLVGVGVYYYISRGLPEIITTSDYRPRIVTRVVAAGGVADPAKAPVIGEFFLERRYITPYESIPDLVIKAFISAEDDQFFQHQGINLASMVRASIANFRAGQVVQGGSTITQQVAKSLLLTPERSFSRKFKEIVLANRIERNLSKQQILYLYLNQIYLGHGAYGVQAAARTYFRKDVADASIGEAALLAGMPTAPGKFSPNQNPKRAKERQIYVLRRMYENGYISQAQMSEAAAEPLKIFDDEDLNKDVGGHLVEYLRRQLIEKYGEKKLFEEGLTVELPISLEMMKVARKSLREGLRAADKRNGYRGALRNLKEPDVEAELSKQRLDLTQRKFKHRLLLPDGSLGLVDALKQAGIYADWQLLVAGEQYEAVVQSIDDKKKSVGVRIGSIIADLPMEKMKWARAPLDERFPKAWRAEPTVPSKVFKKHDVILVEILLASDKGVTVALDQRPEIEGALISLDVTTGNVIAMEGGYEFKDSQYNRAEQAKRQPGSAFKPIIYAAGLSKGFTPATIIVDSPLVYEEGDQGKWKPANFEEKFYGDTTFRQALIKSRNIPTIKIVQSIQVPYLIDFAKKLGMNSVFSPDLSIALGSSTVSLLDLTRVYALFPRLGKRIQPIFVTSIRDRDGKILESEETRASENEANLKKEVAALEEAEAALPPPAPVPTPSPEISPIAAVPALPPVVFPRYPNPKEPFRLLDPRVAYVMTHLMTEVVSFGTGAEAKALGRPAAGKTGTTNDYIDAWFMGFTPHVVTGVWVGYDSAKPLGPGETGAKAALPIWLSFMHEAVKPFPVEDFAAPPGVTFTNINPNTGRTAPANSANSIQEAFISGTEPKEGENAGGAGSGTQSDFFKEDIE